MICFLMVFIYISPFRLNTTTFLTNSQRHADTAKNPLVATISRGLLLKLSFWLTSLGWPKSLKQLIKDQMPLHKSYHSAMLTVGKQVLRLEFLQRSILCLSYSFLAFRFVRFSPTSQTRRRIS